MRAVFVATACCGGGCARTSMRCVAVDTEEFPGSDPGPRTVSGARCAAASAAAPLGGDDGDPGGGGASLVRRTAAIRVESIRTATLSVADSAASE
jgi:hypothetical protein